MRSSLTALLLFCATAAGGFSAASEAPAWSSSLRAESRVTQDTNAFLQNPAPLQAGQIVRGSPVEAHATELIAGATASLRRSPGLGVGLSADFSYGFEWHHFDTFRAESHRDHRLAASLRQITPTWSAETKVNVLAVDGSREGPIYNEVGGTPAMGGEPVRSRRAQTLTTFATSARWQPSPLLQLRSHLTGLHQDFRTFHRSTPTGCANYVDRGQAIAGVDLGRAVNGEFTLWGSLRGGRQWQSNLLGRTDNYSNRLLRPVVGAEGKLARNLRVSFWGGPSYHRFTDERRAGVDHTLTQPFFESTLAWTPRSADTVSLGARQQLWFASAGRCSYREVRTDAAWTHRFSTVLDSALRCSSLHGNFAGLIGTPRNDTVFNATAALGCQLTRALRLDAILTRDWAQTRLPATSGRAYDRWLTTLGAAWLW